MYLIDRDNMGYFNTQDNSQIVQSFPGAASGSGVRRRFWQNNLYFAGAGDVR